VSTAVSLFCPEEYSWKYAFKTQPQRANCEDFAIKGCMGADKQHVVTDWLQGSSN
jgi:hypothetical protein